MTIKTIRYVSHDASPTVCFCYAGGTPEFVIHDAGRVVPYLGN